jgi:hypothetical protein
VFDHHVSFQDPLSHSLRNSLLSLFVCLVVSISLKRLLLFFFKFKSSESDRADLYLFYFYYGVTIFNLIISTFSERFSTRYASELSGIVRKTPFRFYFFSRLSFYFDSLDFSKKHTPENVAPLLYQLTFQWIDS